MVFCPDLDTLLAQNGIEPTLKALSLLNQLPSLKHVAHSTADVHPLFLEQKSQFVRQNIFFSEHFSWPHSTLMARAFLNVKGALVSTSFYQNYFGRNGGFWRETNQYGNKYMNLVVRDLGKKGGKREEGNGDGEAKINSFLNEIWGQVRENAAFDGSVMLVGSIAEFRRLKTMFRQKGSPVGAISEHSSKRKVQSVLAKFNNGESRI